VPGLPAGISSTQSRTFLQSASNLGLFQAQFVQFGEEQQQLLVSQSSQQRLPELLQQLQLPQEPEQQRCAAPFDSARSSSATSKGSQLSDRKTTLAPGPTESSRPAGQAKRPGRRARGRAQECTKKEKVDSHAER